MISNKDTVEITIEKGQHYEARLNVDDKTKFVIKNISNVRFFDPVKQKWIDIGYEGPVSLNYKE